MTSKYQPGQITCYRGLPEKTKRQIAYAANRLRTPQGNVIAPAMNVFMTKLAQEGRLPERISRLVMLAQVASAEKPEPLVEGGNTPDTTSREKPSVSRNPRPDNAELQRYLEELADAKPEPSAEVTELEAPRAERRAIRDRIMGRTPGALRE